MRLTKAECEKCYVSLFVNPTQFGPNEDFSRYPRDEKRDFELAASVGVDVIFAPKVEEMYRSSSTSVRVTRLSDQWEGAARSGHFDGVATVVLKIFNIVRPSSAFFGLKDLQQCAIVKAMTSDFDLDICLYFVETVREPSGLAHSSRNRNLSSTNLTIAPELYRFLIQAAHEIKSTADAIETCKANLVRSGFLVDYVALVNPETMESITENVPGSRIIAAVRIGGTRLIDNVPVESQ